MPKTKTRGRRASKSADKSTPKEALQGYIQHIIFPSYGRVSKNGFAILAINLSGESRVKIGDPGTEEGQVDDIFNLDPNRKVVKGIMPHPRVGDEILFKGRWKEDSQRGWQFEFSEFEIILPTSKQGIVAYFSSDNFYGLGRTAAEKIVAALGDNCLNLLKDNPNLAYEITSLSQKQQGELAKKMGEHGALGDLIALICQHGIGTSTAGRIFAQYGPRSMDIVKENPYQLTKDVDGIGFDKADRIGRAVGIAKNSEFRIQAAIRHVLEEAKSEGHVALRSAAITQRAMKLLGNGSGVKDGDVGKMGLGMVAAGELVREYNKEKGIDFIYLQEMWEAEKRLAQEIKKKVGQSCGVDREIVTPLVEQMEANMGESFRLAPEQKDAVLTALTEKLSVITGGPGTGKTTITQFIISGHESLHPGKEIYLVAPTGRAAKRLSEATGRDASTVHRLLKYNPELGFEFNAMNQLPGPGLLIIDEASMCDLELSNALFQAIPDDVQAVIIGDVAQLPSVGPGAVLRDIINSGAVPVTRLKFVYRQEEGSTIGWLADRINTYDSHKELPKLADINKLDFEFYEAKNQKDVPEIVKNIASRECGGGRSVKDFIVLTPMRERGAASAKALNDVARDVYNSQGRPVKKFGDKEFRNGDRVMWIRKNDYNKGLFNGDLGEAIIEGKDFIFKIDNGNGGVPVELYPDDLMNVELAYSFTIHKAQGSEAPVVVVVCVKSHFILLVRSLIYTGITRAKNKLVIVGSQEAFNRAVRNNKVEARGGLLKERLRGEI